MNEDDFLFGRSGRDLNERKEVKIKLPIAQLIKLHGLKLVNGQTIADTVVAALDRYFEENLLAHQSAPAEPAEPVTAAQGDD